MIEVVSKFIPHVSVVIRDIYVIRLDDKLMVCTGTVMPAIWAAALYDSHCQKPLQNPQSNIMYVVLVPSSSVVSGSIV